MYALEGTHHENGGLGNTFLPSRFFHRRFARRLLALSPFLRKPCRKIPGKFFRGDAAILRVVYGMRGIRIIPYGVIHLLSPA